MKKNKIKTLQLHNSTADSVAEKDSWKDTLYNCPFILLLAVTTAVAMICSDEIGVSFVSRGQVAAQVFETSGEIDTAVETEEEPVLNLGKEHEEMTDALQTDLTAETVTDPVNVATDAENTIVKPLRKSDDGAGQAKEADDKPGITRFEYYEPQHIESIYYSDAGKVAMTTEYDYRMENTSYFDDAAFLGDSRTLGISDYAGLDGADFYCDNGMTIFKLLEGEGITYQKSGKKVDLSEVLQQKHYGKIYMMLGMNELGYGNTEMYLKQYREVVEQIKEWQPDAIIYIMANLHVSREKNNSDTEFNNININDKNAASALLANGKDIFYLDCNPLFTDENGFLNADLTFDGVHLYAQNYDVWRQFLMEHGVEHGETEETDDGGNAVE